MTIGGPKITLASSFRTSFDGAKRRQSEDPTKRIRFERRAVGPKSDPALVAGEDGNTPEAYFHKSHFLVAIVKKKMGFQIQFSFAAKKHGDEEKIALE